MAETLLSKAKTHAEYVKRVAAREANIVAAGLIAAIPQLERYDLTTPKGWQAFKEDIRVRLGNLYEQEYDKLNERLAEFAEQEVSYTARLFGLGAVSILAAQFIKGLPRAAFNLDDKTRMTPTAAFRKLGRQNARELIRVVSDAVLAKKPIEEIQSLVTERAVGRQVNKTKILTKTVTNHTANIARERAIRTKAKFVKYVAISDKRTTKTCQTLNGKIYPVGQGPRPPMHYGCRSTVIPYYPEDE